MKAVCFYIKLTNFVNLNWAFGFRRKLTNQNDMKQIIDIIDK